ncbi:hypothetical protein FKX85_00490 [Echinicola soli]|uniref:DUF2029 domain-containing protein n=1 Tax=Echinicola soli TaxID=2591634 RepID=A0A514CCR6_9BACT|nr:hypothetical protein [Echinicola soli]QDH77598.1 hypothetical protein FKX85_00490 [Echinicola soli]
MKSGKIYSFTDVILAMALTLGGFMVFSGLQPPLQHQLNPLFDANQYEKAYGYFTGKSDNYLVNYPFSIRILVPWFAAQLPFGDIIDNFKAINLLFSLAWIPLWFLVSKKFGLDRFKMWIGWFWITFHWVGVLKGNLSDPITVDVPIYFFQLLLVYCLIGRKWGLLLLITPLMTIQKESLLPLLLVLIVYPGISLWRHHDKKAPIALAAAFFISLLTLKITGHYFPPANAGKNGAVNLFYNTVGLLGHPDLFLRWICAVTLAYGAFLWASIRNRQFWTIPIIPHHQWLIPLALTYVFFSLFAGGDFTRIAFLGSPFIMLVLLGKLELTRIQWGILLVMSIPAMRLFGFLPDGGADFETWKTWHPEYAPWKSLGRYCLYTAIIVLVSWKWLKNHFVTPRMKKAPK